jgi:hypothetical protein
MHSFSHRDTSSDLSQLVLCSSSARKQYADLLARLSVRLFGSLLDVDASLLTHGGQDDDV